MIRATYKLGDVPRTPDFAVNLYLQQLKEIVQTMEGVHDPLDKLVTRKDLLNWGLITEEQAYA